jgi:hypothetical protein
VSRYNACGKRALRDGASTPAALDACVGADPTGQIAKSIAALRLALTKKCSGIDFDTAFPGDCAAVRDIAGCAAERVLCRSCSMLNAMHNLRANCDLFDDGSGNSSCLP